ncbi:hypothetical protein FNV43_RR07002 [Rhamnella rubrinervis]|uniref:Fe2OG dioxygenase domain-containing protein n=1 Tax=Rhamnella rubrinervis TaxID=2594499 RepID=A0A8K0HFQ2_9ROSA|nr:hypothetical protein FNV43_RR07002 [Rhamnella rubrinervis]
MAGVSLPSAENLLSKRVQEMVVNGEQPPHLYICRDDGDEADHQDVAASQLASIPIIDLGVVSESTTNKHVDELNKLHSALSSWGCFQAIGHGISSAFLDSIRQVAKEFFEQPMESKTKYAKGVDEVQGYGADPVPEEGQPLDWSDRLFLDVYPLHKRQPRFWPQTPTSFRYILEEYTVKMKTFTEVVSKAMAKSLKLEEDCFLDQFGERAELQARFNYYSCCERPDLVLGLKPHADGTGYTIILQDDVQSLQVSKDGHWFTVPTISNALLVLLGDQMEIMTNGIYKSPLHRVLSNSKKERLSLVMSYSPESNKEIGPEERLINEETPRVYRNVKNYGATHMEHYQRGQRALRSIRV